jgi:hypothetical protein
MGAAGIGKAKDSDGKGIKPVSIYRVFCWRPYGITKLIGQSASYRYLTIVT